MIACRLDNREGNIDAMRLQKLINASASSSDENYSAPSETCMGDIRDFASSRGNHKIYVSSRLSKV